MELGVAIYSLFWFLLTFSICSANSIGPNSKSIHHIYIPNDKQVHDKQ